jgi:quercetin dioxygenase-like cupin family protein
VHRAEAVPQEVRDDVVRVAKNREPGQTLKQIAADFGTVAIVLCRCASKSARTRCAKSGSNARPPPTLSRSRYPTGGRLARLRRMRRPRGIATVKASKGTSMETIALGALGERLLAEARSAPSGRCAVTVHGGHVNSLRQTAIGLAAGHALEEHENTGEITLQLIRGRARVVAASDDSELVAGDYVVIPLERKSFEALEDAVVLLTATVQGTPD